MPCGQRRGGSSPDRLPREGREDLSARTGVRLGLEEHLELNGGPGWCCRDGVGRLWRWGGSCRAAQEACGVAGWDRP